MNQDILIQLLKNNFLYNQIITEFSDLYSACVIIKQNISPEAIEKSIEKIINYYNTNEKFKNLIDTVCKKPNNSEQSSNDVTGMIMILDKKEESFKKLMQLSKKENWQYKGIAIVDQFDSIRLYFY